MMNTRASGLNKYHFTAILSIIIYVAVALFVFINTSTSYFVLKLFCAFIVAISLSCILYYVFSKPSDPRESIWVRFKWELIYIGSVIVIYFPLLTQNYLFYDDYWIFLTKQIDQVAIGISVARPLNGLCMQLFDSLDFPHLYIAKWFATAAIILFGLIIMKWTFEKSQNRLVSFAVALAVCFTSAIIDSVGYGATDPLALGLAGAAFSVIAFEKSYTAFSIRRLSQSFIYTFVAFASLMVGFYSHQLATPIIFLMLAIELYFNKKREGLFKKDILYIAFYVFSAILFLLSIKLFAEHYHTMVSVRGQFVSSIPEIIVKIRYFFLIVFNQSVNQLLASIFGSSLFRSPGRIFLMTMPKYPFVGYTSAFILLAIVVFAIVRCLFKNTRIIDIIMLLVFFPLSYYTLFILKETNYISYYVVPLVSLLTFLFIVGLDEIFDLVGIGIQKAFHKNLHVRYLLVILVIVMALQGNYYMNNFWVYYNRSGYEFVRNTIYNQKDASRWIHVYGVLYPGQGNIYSVFTAQTALREMGIDPNSYKVTTSDNQYYISIIQDSDFQKILSKLDGESRKWLTTVYRHDDTYSRYSISIHDPSQETLDKLRNCFVKAGYIPENDHDAIIVDLRWVNAV